MAKAEVRQAPPLLPFCVKERLSFPVSVFFDYSVVIFALPHDTAQTQSLFQIRPKPA